MLINTILTSGRLIIALSLMLFVLLCLSLMYSAHQWQADWHLAQLKLDVPPPTALKTDTAEPIHFIPEAHLFGKSISKDVPITNLQLRVTGIVQGIQNTSKAYISISDQPSKIYRQGDSLPYGVKIYAITSNTVILENGEGHLEKLPLPRMPLEFKSPITKEDHHE